MSSFGEFNVSPYKVHLDARWPPNMTCLKETLLRPIVSDALYVVDQSQQPGPSDQSEPSRLTVRRGFERLNLRPNRLR